MYRYGPLQKKIMLTLLGGVALGMLRDPGQYYRTLRLIRKDWKRINQSSFNRSIGRLAQEKLVEERSLPGGSFKLVLTAEGKKQARKLKLLGNAIKFKKPKKWDGKWRVVIFDIPEKDRIFRNILRQHLRELRFQKLQHSVFVSPYPFEKAILELVNLYSVQRYVRVITAEKIDNEDRLGKSYNWHL